MHQCFPVAEVRAVHRGLPLLCALHPGSFAKKALLVNSGAEAVENAVKIARYVTGRDAVITLRPGLPRPHDARACR